MTWKYGSWGKYAPLMGRVFLSLVFIIAGWGKLAGFSGAVGYIASLGLPMPELMTLLAIIAELGGGLALLFGFHTRAAAWVLGIFTLIAILVAHRDLGDQMQLTQALKNLAIIGGLVYVAKYGGGTWSLGTSDRCGCCDDGSCVCDSNVARKIS